MLIFQYLVNIILKYITQKVRGIGPMLPRRCHNSPAWQKRGDDPAHIIQISCKIHCPVIPFPAVMSLNFLYMADTLLNLVAIRGL